MSVTDDLLANNATYTESFEGPLPLPPAKKLAVLACMDARLNVYALLGLNEGESHVIRNAGGVVTDDEIRSLAISQRLLGTEEIILIHHTDCGMLTSPTTSSRSRSRTRPASSPSGPPSRSPTSTRTCASRSTGSRPRRSSRRRTASAASSSTSRPASSTRSRSSRAASAPPAAPPRAGRGRRRRRSRSPQGRHGRLRPASRSGRRRPAPGRGQLGVHGVQVVAQGRTRHRLPAVVRGSARIRETSSGRPSRSPTSKCMRATSVGSRSSRAAVSTTPRIMYAGGHTATRTARSSGTPFSTSASRRSRTPSSSRPIISVGQLGHHLLDDHLEVVDDRLGVLGEPAAVEQPAGGPLDQGAAPRAASGSARSASSWLSKEAIWRCSRPAPKISRATKLARVSSAVRRRGLARRAGGSR